VSTNEYPIDTSVLDRGSTIAPDVIEEIFRVKRGTDAFGLARLRLQGFIMWRLAERGLDVICCADRACKYGLRVLTDEERATYTDHKFEQALDACGLALRQQQGTDRAQLTDRTKATHDRALQINGFTYGAARKARRKALTLRAVVRQTPALPK
jgi:hypothetical protein